MEAKEVFEPDCLHTGACFVAVAHQSKLVCHPKLQRKDLPVAEELFGMYNIHIYCIVSQVMLDEERQVNKIEFFTFGFSTSRKLAELINWSSNRIANGCSL